MPHWIRLGLRFRANSARCVSNVIRGLAPRCFVTAILVTLALPGPGGASPPPSLIRIGYRSQTTRPSLNSWFLSSPGTLSRSYTREREPALPADERDREAGTRDSWVGTQASGNPSANPQDSGFKRAIPREKIWIQDNDAMLPLSLEPSLIKHALMRSTRRYRGSMVLADLESGKLYSWGTQVDEPHTAASTFKLMTSYVLLDSGNMNPLDLVTCSPTYTGRRRFRCFKPGGHGPLDMIEALALSCNIYFHKQHNPAFSGRVVSLAQHFGYRLKDGEELVLEPPVLVHGGPLVISPRDQMNVLLSLVPGPVHPDLKTGVPFLGNQKALEAIRMGMELCVAGGSGEKCQIGGMPVAGKTGSWEGTRWFLSYAPARNPKIAMVAFSMGGSVRKSVCMTRNLLERLIQPSPGSSRIDLNTRSNRASLPRTRASRRR